MKIIKKKLLNNLNAILNKKMSESTGERISVNRLGDNYSIYTTYIKSIEDNIRDDCLYLISVLKKRYGSKIITPELEKDLEKIFNAIVNECKKEFSKF